MSVGSATELLAEGPSVDAVELVAGDVTARSPRQLFWRRFRADRVAMVSAAFIILLILIAIFAPLLIKLLGLPGPNVQDPNATDASAARWVRRAAIPSGSTRSAATCSAASSTDRACRWRWGSSARRWRP